MLNGGEGPGRGISLRDGLRDFVDDPAPENNVEHLNTAADHSYHAPVQHVPQHQSIMLTRYMQE